MFTFPIGHFSGGAAPLLLDGMPATAGAWSMARRLLSSYTGSLIRLRRDSDNAESDFGYDAAGNLDTAAITSWLGGATGYVVKIYRQDGTGDFHQATAANQPTYVASAIGTRSAARCDGAARYIIATFTTYSSDKLTICYPGKRSSVVANAGLVTLYKGSGFDFDTASDCVMYEGGAGVSIITYRTAALTSHAHPGNNVGFYYVVKFDGANCTAYLDSAVSGPAGSSGNFGFVEVRLGIRGTGEIYNGWGSEVIIFSSALSDADRGTMETDAETFWGTP